MQTQNRNLDAREIGKFSKDSARWWDLAGPFGILHRINPVRLAYIREQIMSSGMKMAGIEVLDAGCGGGLVCAPLARLGAVVRGIDADSGAIDAARAYAQGQDLRIAYDVGSIEDVPPVPAFNVILALEVLEHVPDPVAFLQACAARLKPQGLLIVSTLNRTPQSFALGIVGAEYVLGWVPRGTHDWRRFLRPAEIARMGRENGLSVRDVRGLVFNPLKGTFSLAQGRTQVNYFMTFTKG